MIPMIPINTPIYRLGQTALRAVHPHETCLWGIVAGLSLTSAHRSPRSRLLHGKHSTSGQITYSCAPEPYARRRGLRRDESQRPGDATPPHRSGRHLWWRRHIRELFGVSVLAAAIVVLLWPGPLLDLAVGAVSIATILLLGLTLALALRHRTRP